MRILRILNSQRKLQHFVLYKTHINASTYTVYCANSDDLGLSHSLF